MNALSKTQKNAVRTTGKRDETRVYTPRADLFAGEEALLLQVDLPGVTTENLSVEVHQDQLHLLGKRSETVSYRRVLRLPDGIDVDKIEAELKHGVLTLTLPRSRSHKPRRIRVSG